MSTSNLFRMVSLEFDYLFKAFECDCTNELPYEYGTSTTNLNGGIVHNRGIEFTVRFTPVRTDDWAVSVSLNSSKNWNKTGKSEIRLRLVSSLEAVEIKY